MAKKSNKPAETVKKNGKDQQPGKKTNAVTMAERRAKQKKNQLTQQQQQKKKKKEKGRLLEYFRGVKLEMKKVVWPTRQELSSFTAVVLAVCAFFALLFWGVDSGVLAAIKAICF